MSEHTKEPWSVDPRANLRVRDSHDNTICSCGTTDLIRDQWEENARRIVTCVNACAGIPTHGLEGMSVALTLSEMADVQQQRDELAKAMQIIATTPGSAAHHRIAHQALAGINVTPNAELTGASGDFAAKRPR